MSAKKMPKNHQVYIGIGSNIAPEENVPDSVRLLHQYVKVSDISKVWETPPVGCGDCDNYLNAAVLIETDLTAEQLRQNVLRKIEKQLGRVRTTDKYAPRTIDLDILIYDQEIIDQDIWQFAFLAVPVAELIPTLKSRRTGNYIQEVANRLQQTDKIKLRLDISLSDQNV